MGRDLGARGDTGGDRVATRKTDADDDRTAAGDLLTHAHAIEQQTTQLPNKAPQLALVQERAAAAPIHDLFDHALDASLEEAGVRA